MYSPRRFEFLHSWHDMRTESVNLRGLMVKMRQFSSVAASRGYPAFLSGEAASNPINATPYVADLSELRDGGYLRSGAELLDPLCESISDLVATGAQPLAVLIGGSALEPGREPKDLDCVVFYTGSPADGKASIAHWLEAARARSLDIRLVPIDGDPVLALKSALFFGALYARRRGDTDPGKGLLLVDCRG